jgi:4-hydroxybenzoate polyprenyltransferase
MSKIKNYIELTRIKRPTGIILLFLPCLFGVFYAVKGLEFVNFAWILWISALFLIGSIIMRGAGCVINDIMDRKFDKKVARTKNRMIASGKISVLKALILASAFLVLGFIILLQFNEKVIISGFLALFLVFLYPLMKRITFFPQIFLGITFNYGILMGFLAVNFSLSLNVFLLYFACVIWTLIYDTIYAFQDIDDDLKIGVKSSAIAFQRNPREILLKLTILMGILLILAGILQKMGIFYYFFTILALV